MDALPLHDFHKARGAEFTNVNGGEAVLHYGGWLEEYGAYKQSAAVIDLSFRSRLCVVGADRQKFLNGQVTNNVKDLRPGGGCYAALVTAKARIQSDLNVHCLENEILLDFEPGYSNAVRERLEKYVIADDVQIVDAAPAYGLISVQGPASGAVIEAAGLGVRVPAEAFGVVSAAHAIFGEIYVANHARLLSSGCDVYAPLAALPGVAEGLAGAAAKLGGRLCGWQAFETARIEAGIPRFGADMDESNLAPETGIESRAISYTKGCYIGQEVIARIRTYGQVARKLCGFQLPDGLRTLPAKGTRLFKDGKEAGCLTSSIHSPAVGLNIALGYARRETNEIGSELAAEQGGESFVVRIVPLPFVPGASSAG